MDGYCFKLRCRHCGGKCLHVTGGEYAGNDSRAVAKCADCQTEWLVAVTLHDPSGGRQKRTPARRASMVKARELAPTPPSGKGQSRNRTWNRA